MRHLSTQPIKFICTLLVLLCASAGTTFAGAQPPTAKDVLYAEVNAEGQHNWQLISNNWTDQERPNLTSFLDDRNNQSNGIGYFNIVAARIVELKELSADAARPFVDVDEYRSQYGNATFFYVGIDYRVHQETMFYYNGTNYRLATVVPQNNRWRLAELSDVPVDTLIASGYGFGSNAENTATRIHKARNKGLFINVAGKTLANVVATPEQLRREHGNVPRDTTITTAVAGDHTYPSNIRVYLTKTTNKQWFGCANNCTRSLDFTYYIRDVLPNEWSVPNWPTESYKAGAEAVKMYGWYHVYNPKWPQYNASVQDNTNDQVYIVNTAKTYSNNAISTMAGTGLETGTFALFVTHYVAGYYQSGNYHSGWMWQNGTHYWADQRKTWIYMCSYYWDNSPSTGNQPVVVFAY